MLSNMYLMMALQLVDSDIASTRLFWRRDVWGMNDDIAKDSRSMRDITGYWPDWRKIRVVQGKKEPQT